MTTAEELTIRHPRYRVLGELGRGSMGIVLRAIDLETSLEVALKRLPPAAALDLPFLKSEFRAVADVTHPNLVQLYDLVVSPDDAFFTMELIDGSDMAAWVAAQPDRVAAVRALLPQLAAGLSALHSLGKVHRDLKPGNVLVDRTGRLVLTDYGLVADVAPEAAAGSSSFAGTAAYAAPEVLLGAPASRASDWYGAGCVLYECLSGDLPSFDATVAGRSALADELRRRAPVITGELCSFVVDLLDAEPAMRLRAADGLSESSLRPLPTQAIWRRNATACEMVGRDRESERLRTAIQASSDRPLAVVVQGRSGIGKSTLLEHALGQLTVTPTAPVLVFRSRCHPNETVPFRAADGWVDDLAAYLRSDAEDMSLPSPAEAAALARAFPALAWAKRPIAAMPSATEEDAGDLRRTALIALRTMLERVAARSRLLLVIEDLHWGDLDSLAILELVLRSTLPLRLVVTYRSEEAADNPVIVAFEKLLATPPMPHVERIRLEPLSVDESMQLLAGALDGADVGEAAALLEEAEGSPLLLGELARAVQWRRRTGDGGAVTRLADMLELRTSRLSPTMRRVLEAAAVAGEPTSRSTVLRAAGIGERGRPLLATLHQASLLRLGTYKETPVVEVFHDRIRTGILGSLADERRRQCHTSLAEALVGDGTYDAGRVAHHWHGAGVLDRAADFAEQAADRADTALAFLRAAAFYRNAIEWDAPRAGHLTRKLAASYAHAGHTEDAAVAFAEAAESARGLDAVELRARAAEQLLIGGRIDAGVEALQAVLASVGLSLPAGPRTALAGTALRLTQLAVRGLRFRARTEAEVDVRERLRVDLCYAAGRGLLAVDTVRGAYLPCRGLLLALQAGEPTRIAKALCGVGGGVLAPMPRALARWGDRMLAVAAEIARASGDPYVPASLAIAQAQRAVMDGRWRGAVDHAEAALTALEECRGVHWERVVAHMPLLRGLEEMGRFQELLARARELREAALSRGDRYGVMTAALFEIMAEIAADRPEQGVAVLDEAARNWSQSGFHVQHFYEVRARCMADLYMGRADLARERLQAMRPRFRGSVLERVPITRIDALVLEARVAATANGDPARALPSRMVREMRSARGASALTARLVLAASSTQRDGELQDVERQCREADMAALADVARLKRLRARPANATAAHDDPIETLAAAGVRDPLRWANAVVPSSDSVDSYATIAAPASMASEPTETGTQ